MRWLRIIGLLLIVALVQSSMVPALAIRHVRPDLLLLVAVCIAAREPLRKGWRWNAFWIGWAAGLLEDIYSAGSYLPLGTAALVFGLVAVAVSRLSEDLFLESALAQVLILAPVCVAAQGTLAVALAVLAGGHTGPVLAQGFWAGMYSAALGPLVFAAMRPLERFLGVRSRRSFGSAS